jgi:hypothetical protein
MMPISGQQVPSVPLQAGTLPSTVTPTQLDINSIMNLMILLVVVVMMMKVMTRATERV